MENKFDLDQRYLHEVIGDPLTKAMTQLAILHPIDPVEFLGNYLLKHVANEEAQQRLTNRKQQMTLAMPLNYIREVSEERIREQEWERTLKEEKYMQAEVLKAPSIAQMFQSFSEWIALVLNAEEAYIGRKCVNLDGIAIIHFIASSKHHTSTVLNQLVAQPADEEHKGSIHHGVGVTFDVFKKMALTHEHGNPVADYEGEALLAAPPKWIHVENVLREPRVKFFGIPKLGALVSRAGNYKSYLHADVYNESSPDEPNGLEQWLVFSADTMGQARAFTKKEIARFLHATELFVTLLEEKERELYMKDKEQHVFSHAPILEEYRVAFAAHVASQEEKIVALLPEHLKGEELCEASQRQRAAHEAELWLSFLTTRLVSHTTTLSIASSRVVPFKEFVLWTFAAALNLLGYTRIELFSPATGRPSWNQISPLLGKERLTSCLKVFEASLGTMKSLANANSTSKSELCAIRHALPATLAALSMAKQTFTDVSKAEVDAASPVASAFYVWGLAVVARAESLNALVEHAQKLEDEAAATRVDE